MKFMSATAVFAAALSSVTEASSIQDQIKNTDCNVSKVGYSTSQAFTDMMLADNTEYRAADSVSFYDFSTSSGLPRKHLSSSSEASPTTEGVSSSSSGENTENSQDSAPSSGETDEKTEEELDNGGIIYAREKLTISESQDSLSNQSIELHDNSIFFGEGEVIFDHRVALKNGGAIYGEKEVVFENIKSLLVEVNIAVEKGGSVYAKERVSLENVTEATFSSNGGEQGGGGIYSEQDMLISDCNNVHFQGNAAGATAVKQCLDEEMIVLLAECVDSLSEDTLDSTPETEQTESNGNQDGSSETEDTQVSESPESTPSPDDVLGKGGGIYTEKSLTITGITGTIDFVSNIATDSGAGVFTKENLSCTNTNSLQFLKNSAGQHGGGAYVTQTMSVTNTTSESITTPPLVGEVIFSENTAKGHGGGICTNKLSLSNLKTVTLTKNSAKECGGAIFTDLASIPTTDTPESSTPSSSSPASTPEVVASAKINRFFASTAEPAAPSLTEAESDQTDQTETSDTNGDIDVSIENILNVAINQNTSAKKGGAIYGKKAKLSRINNLELSGNSSQDVGGGLCLTESVEFDAIGSLLSHYNSAAKEGGAIHSKTVTLSNLKSTFTFADNTVKAIVESTPEAPEEIPPVEGEESTATEDPNSNTEGSSASTNLKGSQGDTADTGTGDVNNESQDTSDTGNAESGEQLQDSTQSNEENALPNSNIDQSNENTDESSDSHTEEITDESVSSSSESGSSTPQDGGAASSGAPSGDQSISANACLAKSYAASTDSSPVSNSSGLEEPVTSSSDSDVTASSDNPDSSSSGDSAGDSEELTETEAGSTTETPTLIGGGAIYGETVKIENFSGQGIFSGNKAIDNTTEGSSSKSDVLGGAVYAKTLFNLDSGSSRRTVTFSGNTVSSQSTTGQVAGGAIYSPTVTIATPVVFSKNSATNNANNATDTQRKDTFGGAIGATSAVSLSGGAHFLENVADLGSAIGLVPGTQNTETVKLESGSYYFEKNKALKRATIYAPVVSIKAYTATFNQNRSLEEGSAIYFTKEASIESLGSVLFTGNLVTLTLSTTTEGTPATTSGDVTKYGAAIFGQIASSNGSQTDNLPLKLIASGGNICFRNNEYRPTSSDTGTSTFCSIAGDVKLTMQAAKGKTISFFDAIRTSTKKTGTQATAYDTLDINKSEDSETVNSAFTGTILFSSELHENKSYIPQNVVLHSGSLVLKPNTELHVISFEQKEGSSLVMTPGSVLSNQTVADGALVINNMTIDLSSVEKNGIAEGNIFTPPELRIIDTTTSGSGGTPSTDSESNQNSDDTEEQNNNDASNQGESANGSSSPAVAAAHTSRTRNFAAAATATPTTTPTATTTTSNQVILGGEIKLIDPNGTFFQNPALRSDQQISLLVLPTDSSKMQAQKIVLTGNIAPQKGYTGTLTLDPDQLQNGTISVLWKFDSYRQWAYVPRDNHFYANSILGSQMSMVTVKQGLLNDKMNLARFEEVSYNNLWISGLGTMLSQVGTPTSEEFTYYSRGASVALDAKPAHDVIVGAAFSKMIGKTKSLKRENNYTHKGSEYSYQASVYGGKPFHFVINKKTEKSLPLLLQGVISYGYIKHDTVTHYPTIRERNKGEWEDLGWLTALRVSSVLRTPAQGDTKRITVYGELEYSSIRQKQFTETEYDPRYFDNCTYRNLAIPMGLAFEGELSGNDILMYNRFSVAYMPSIYRNSPTCKYQVLSSGEGGEIICGVPTRNSARGEYSTQLYLGPLWTLYGSYTIEADAHTLAHMMNCGARMTF